MGDLKIIPFYNIDRSVSEDEFSMVDVASLLDTKKPENCFTYESSVIFNLEFYEMKHDYWQSFLFRVATPLYEPEAKQTGHDGLTSFLDSLSSSINDSSLSIFKEKRKLIERKIRSKLKERTAISRKDTGILKFSTQGFIVKIKSTPLPNFPDCNLKCNVSFYTLALGKHENIFNLLHCTRKDEYPGLAMKGPFLTILKKLNPGYRKISGPIPISALSELEKGVGKSEYFLELLLNIKNVYNVFWRSSHEGFVKSVDDIMQDAQFYPFDDGYYFERFIDRLIGIFQRYLVHRALEKAKIKKEGNTPVTFCGKSEKIQVNYPFNVLKSGHNVCTCLFPPTWFYDNANDYFNTICAVGMKLVMDIDNSNDQDKCSSVGTSHFDYRHPLLCPGNQTSVLSQWIPTWISY